jgi:hypothetical protein
LYVLHKIYIEDGSLPGRVSRRKVKSGEIGRPHAKNPRCYALEVVGPVRVNEGRREISFPDLAG